MNASPPPALNTDPNLATIPNPQNIRPFSSTAKLADQLNYFRFVWLALTLICFLAVQYIPPMFGKLVTPQAPYGILSLQLACRAEDARQILLSWGPLGRKAAFYSLLFDLPLILCYTLSALSWIVWTERRCKASCGPVSLLARVAIIGGLSAASADVCEDGLHAAMLYQFGRQSCFLESLPLWATSSAALKFTLLALTSLLIGVSWTRQHCNKPGPAEQPAKQR